MSDVFDTYVRNADEFYTRLYNDEEYRKEILETIKNLLPSYGELKKYYSEVTLEQFWEDLKGVFGRPPSSNEGSLVYNVKINSKKHNVEVIDTNKVKKDEIEKSIIEEIVKHDEIKTITLNSQTYNIQQLSNLELRNAIDYIPKVSFLLSNILIKAGETIDLGTKGLYKVKSGDILSTIAQNNKLITKDLLKLNPHLIDNLNISKYKRTLTYTHKWQGNEEKEEDKKFTISGSVVKSSQGLKVKEIISGNGKIIDDDKDDKQDPEDVDPIIIDLNKNKITSTKLNNTTYFDHDNNNFKEASSWIDKGDAFLALDKNSNGLIDNENELFGNHTISNTKYGEKEANNKDTSINGYEALKAYDLNGDIDSKDEIYDKLVLWKDSNQNAITDKGSTTIANDVWFK